MADDQSDGPVESVRIVRKMDETAESSVKRENEENESGNDISRNESPLQTCAGGSVLSTSPRMRYSDLDVRKSCDSSRLTYKSPTVLRPSQLNGNVGNNSGSPKPASSSSFLLNPSRLNPFAKTPDDDEINDRDERKPIDTSKPDCNAPKFLPLLQNGSKTEPVVKTSAASTSTVISRSNDFVFGQNIHDRVVSDSNKAEDSKSTCSTNANGTSDMLFSSALKDAPVSDNSCSTARCRTTAAKSLSESAREYEASRATKRKYEEVEVKTGEEGETNVLQITCKLFAFDKIGGGSWQERGRGVLRLNDREAGGGVRSNSHSRLVFRTAGSFRVVLNTKVWPEMKVQRASDRSIRLTAFDSSGEVKVFLLTGNPEDVKQLQKHLETRIRKETEKHDDRSEAEKSSEESKTGN